MTKKIYIKTWGCQMNEYDSSKIEILLTKNNNFKLINNAEDADIILLNTCSIREKAQEKLFHQLGRWRLLKQIKKNLIIGVGGCVASQESELILKRANYVNIIFGPQSIHRLPEMINNVYKKTNPIIDISFSKIEKFNYFNNKSFNKPISYISIMEGCNKYCTFCVVPYTRGEEISRPCNDILSEIIQLVNKGVCEIILLGQNVNSYCGLFNNGSLCNFPKLLHLISSINGIKRIRYLTSHPAEFTDELINVYYEIPKLVSFVHLPVQSGSDNILNIMKRGYSISQYKSIIRRLMKVRPNIHISSDFIIGFPGETRFDFNQTIDLINEINFDMSFSFIYSNRPGTPAANLIDDVSKEEKKTRLYLLQSLIMQKSIQFSFQMKGTIQRVLIEGLFCKEPQKLYGRTENNRLVYLIASPSIIGQIVDVEITDVYLNTLNGVLFKI